jgi:hypothetical protein
VAAAGSLYNDVPSAVEGGPGIEDRGLGVDNATGGPPVGVAGVFFSLSWGPYFIVIVIIVVIVS